MAACTPTTEQLQTAFDALRRNGKLTSTPTLEAALATPLGLGLVRMHARLMAMGIDPLHQVVHHRPVVRAPEPPQPIAERLRHPVATFDRKRLAAGDTD